MRALIFSDSHGQLENLRWMLEDVWKYTGPIDYYFHLGDGASDFERLDNFIACRDPLSGRVGVAGNCDWHAKDIPLTRIISFGKHCIFVTHGHFFGVKNELSTIDHTAHEQGCDITLYGHTHIQASEQRETLLINPGSVMNDRCAMITEKPDGTIDVRLIQL